MKIDESVQKLLQDKQIVVHLFYDIFLDRYPEVREYFEGVDLEQQAVLLTMGLVMVENHYTHSYPATEHYIRVLGHRHHTWGIPEDLYPPFRDCLLETLENFHGDEWDEELAAQWKAAIDCAIATMLEGYQRPYVY